MCISNFEKVSLKDYPSKISTICFVRGCQLRCPYCHNPSLVLPSISSFHVDDRTSEFVEYIKRRKDLLDGVVISGGEPLTKKNILSLIYTIKELGLKVKLDTNGMLPNKLKPLLDEDLLDYIALDYKASVEFLNQTVGLGLNDKDNNLYNAWAQSLIMLNNSNVNYELRTTIVKQIHSKSQLIHMATELNALIPDQIPKWFLQTFERQSAVLCEFENKEITLSAYSKDEMLEIKQTLETILPNIHLRDIL